MSYEDEFAAAEAMLRAEEEAAASGNPPPAPLVTEEKVDMEFKSGQHFKVDLRNIDIQIEHGANQFYQRDITENRVNNMSTLLAAEKEVLLRVIDVARDVSGCRIAYPDGGTYLDAYIVISNKQVKDYFIPANPSEWNAAVNHMLIVRDNLRAEAEKKAEELRKKAAEKKKAREAELAKGLEGTRAKWAELLDDIYPDNWEIDSSNRLTIKFPEIEIINSAGKTHTIRDLYVVWGLNKHLAPSVSIRGYRGLKTVEEYESGYNHSHLGTGWDRGWDNTFCLGSGDFANLLNGLNADQDLDWDLIQKALIMINMYVGWESTEGGPYIYMRDIKRRNGSTRDIRTLSNPQIEEFYNQWLASNPDLAKVAKLQNTNGSMLFRVNEDALDASLVERVKSTFGDDFVEVISENGRRTRLTTVNAGNSGVSDATLANYNDNLRGASNRNRKFKGEPVICRIYIPGEDVDKKDLKDLKQVPSRIISDFIKRKFENELNIYAINKSHELSK